MKDEPPLPPDFLTLSAVRGARLVALQRLDRASREADHLASDPHDLKGLHDLRVALRRVRSWLRAFRPELEGGAGSKDRHRLRDLAEITNRGRDADVQLAWLKKTARRADVVQKRGAERLIDLIDMDRRDAMEPLNGEWLEAFRKEGTRLAERLSTVREPVRASAPPPTLAAAIGARLADHLDAFRRALYSVRSPDDDREAHAARIAAKRLRYLLEPAEGVRGSKSLLAQLKTLQNDLGALHDAHILGRRVDEAIANSLGMDREGLVAIAETLAAERAAVFNRIERRWMLDDAAIAAFSRSVGLVAERLKARSAG